MSELASMKIIWFSHFVPFPPRGGNLQRSFNLIRQASQFHEVHLIALNLQGEPPDQLRRYETELKQYCQSIELCELPFPWRGRRWWAEAMSSPLFKAPFSCRALFSRPILARWKQLLNAHADALLHFDSIDLALYADSANGFRKVLNHHNCESAMTYRQAGNERNPLRKKYMQLQATKLADSERSLCAAFDVNTVVSDQDRKLLQVIQPNGHYHVVENGVDIHHFVPSIAKVESRSAIFTGWLGWGPNISAMNFVVGRVWPEVKERYPDARLYLAGKNPPEHVLRWSKEDSSITVVPNPEDMRPWLARAAVCICPILEGGGTRLKILDAMAMGKPMVSTTIGCEGLRVTHGENILVADTPREFSNRLVQLFENEDLRRQIGAAGRALVEREYCWERIGQQLEKAYQRARQPASYENRKTEKAPTQETGVAQTSANALERRVR
jgi:polysaccharide biosynthesis protein PslH